MDQSTEQPSRPRISHINVPLVVMERCSTPQQLCVWIAIRWLLAECPDRTEFGRQEIAERVHVSEPKVLGWVDELEKKELITAELGKRREKRRYAIPLHKLERISEKIVDVVLEDWGVQTPENRAELWNPMLPLVVLEHCHDAYMINIWLALRWLQLVFPDRDEFPAKTMLARRANVNQKYVYWSRPGIPSFIDRLILVELVQNLSENGSTKKRRITIPPEILNIQNKQPEIMTVEPQQVSTTPTKPKRVHATAQMVLDLGEDTNRPLTAREQAEQQPRKPANWDIWPPLPIAPADLWRRLWKPVDEAFDWGYLADLAARHDPATSDCGWFYVGQALLATLDWKADMERKSEEASKKRIRAYIEGALAKCEERGYTPRTARKQEHSNGNGQNGHKPSKESEAKVDNPRYTFGATLPTNSR